MTTALNPIGIGTTPGDGTGDAPRAGFTKVKSDHAHFLGALGYRPTTPGTFGSTTSAGTVTVLNDSTQNWATNQFAGQTLTILTGVNLGYSGTITSNTATSITLSAAINGTNIIASGVGYQVSPSPTTANSDGFATHVGGTAPNTLIDGNKLWTTNQWQGLTCTLLSGPYAGQTFLVASNTSTTLTLAATLSAFAAGTSYVLGSLPLGAAVTILPSGDTSGTTDAAIAGVFLGMPGTYIFPPGTYYYPAAGLTWTAKVILRGAGSADGGSANPGGSTSNGTNASTIFRFGTTSSSASTGVTLTAQGSVMEDIAVVDVDQSTATSPTAGAGITLNGAHGGQVNRCSTYGFYIGIQITNTVYYSLTYNKVFGPVLDGIRQDNQGAYLDGGDCLIHGNWIIAGSIYTASTPAAAIRITGGGGAKLTGNKVNGWPTAITNAQRWTNGVLLQPAASTGSTSVFVIGDNSIESVDADCILMDGSLASGGPYTWQGFAISGNEFASVTGACLVIKGSAAVQFNDIVIGDNMCPGTISCYVNAYSYCNNVNIGAFSTDACSGAMIAIGQGAGFATPATVSNVTYDLGKISCHFPVGVHWLLDYTSVAEDAHVQGCQVLNMSREIPLLTGVLATNSANGTGTIATIGFASTTTAIPVGAYVSIAGVTPAGYNGVYLVTASNATSVSFANTTTGGQTVAGTLSIAVLAIGLQPYNCARVKVIAAGQLEGYGGEITIAERALIANGSSPAVLTANTIGTDYDFSVSGKMKLGFNVNVGGECYVTLSQTAAGAAAEKPIGSITFEISGPVYSIQRL